MEPESMPTYSNTPPAESSGVSLPIVRTPAARPLKAIVTSDDILGCNTHFWHGHTVPCDGKDCEPCRDSTPFRWHAYCTAFVPNSSLHFLFECTAAAAEQFVKYRHAFGTLRGCMFEAYRWRQKVNGRIILKTERTAMTDLALPPAPDLEKVLAILWQLPEQNVQAGDHTAGGRHVEADTDVADPFKPKPNQP